MGTHHPIRKTVATIIPDKLYFRIGDVARLCEVPAYVLRFWETEFPQLKPNKGGTGQRLYRKRDVEMALRIKSLLYDQGYTIPGARQVFKADVKPPDAKLTEMKPKDSVRPLGMALASVEAAASVQLSAGASAEVDSAGPVTLDSMRRDVRLQALRAEMASLLASLSKPVSASGRESKVHAMRPRPAAERSKLTQLSLEGDLF